MPFAHNTCSKSSSPLILLSRALAVSLTLHILALVATNDVAHPVLYRHSGDLKTTLQLPGSRTSIDTSIASPATATTTSTTAPSQSDSEMAPLKSQDTIPFPPISAYHPQSELSFPALPLAYDELPQPEEPLDGYAELTLLLRENGSVDAVLTTKSSFPPDYFNRLEKFFSDMKFQPGRIDGIPQKSRFVIEVRTSRLPEILESNSLTEERQPPP